MFLGGWREGSAEALSPVGVAWVRPCGEARSTELKEVVGTRKGESCFRNGFVAVLYLVVCSALCSTLTSLYRSSDVESIVVFILFCYIIVSIINGILACSLFLLLAVLLLLPC